MSKEQTEALQELAARIDEAKGKPIAIDPAAAAELRRLSAANAELLGALEYTTRKLRWFVGSYPHDIAVSKRVFFAPIDAAIAKHQPKKGTTT